MPKNGTYKKNVSKQVKKDNEQKGGGGSKDTNTVKVVIAFNNKPGEILFPVLEQWNTTQQIKDSNYPNYNSKDNEYYIDSFVSRKILEVLQYHGDKYESIVYDGTDTQTSQDPEIIEEGSSWRFLFTKEIDKPNEVKKNSDIKKCDIKDLNTFAMIRNHIDKGRWDESVYSPNHIILPYKLNFKLTLKEGEDDNESQTLEQRINEQIDDKIKEKVEELKSKHEENKKKLAALKKQFKDDDKYRGGAKKSKKLPKKEILGKMISIYKIQGDRKEYVKHKGKLTTIKDYKALMKQKAKKPTKLSKKK